ncbi:MAG TPA: hypothetical protein VFV93_07445 [Thermomicrobiales bacterium]|nr:hypothetical protein [Thermomicrobiales bacterium]
MMTGADVVKIVSLFEDAGIAFRVDGGWGIDALVGEPTRPHDDLDLVIDRQQNEDAIALLANQGFSMHVDQRPVSFILRAADDRRVDIHPVRFDTDGAGWQALPDGSEFSYTPEGLTGTGTIAGHTVRCLTAELQVACHLGYEPDGSDIHDMRLLRNRFGVSLPSLYNR